LKVSKNASGVKNLNASEGVESDQVSIAGDDAFRQPAYGKFQEFIVFGIVAGNDLQIDVDPLSLAG